MKRLLLLFVFLMSNFYLNAQINLDSLYSIWEDTSQTDSTRFIAYKDFIKKGFLESKPDSALLLAEELISFGEGKESQTLTAKGYDFQGDIYFHIGNYNAALKYYKASLDIFQKIGNKKEIATSNIRIGGTF